MANIVLHVPVKKLLWISASTERCYNTKLHSLLFRPPCTTAAFI